ncbi:hypothetical protein [Fusibacter ferrireducens]|uniref:CobQ/CobB/MinD/ParA nucleotide binding domain-containing protein n=1 Tax=Fusibacter ferrireducens TaxID=2785058 RepID=A0ABR9ZQ60_9FIRM|nr:hypothetical protein [Fusibacter ferrireducens]MBF4692268.1 hypothetical protein [Fusibacter ferrireducens]
MEHFNYVFIDLNALKDCDEELMEAVIGFKKMFSSRMIFYIDMLKEKEKLILQLIEAGIYNIVISEEMESLKTEVLKSISDLGISKREIQSKISKEDTLVSCTFTPHSFVKKDIKIAVAGVQHRVGTTTMAINLANYLANIGASVCYVEANDHDHLRNFPEFYQGMIMKEGIIQYHGVKYLSLHSECHDEFDFIIYDMGVVNNRIIEVVRKKCDAAILCATGKPYENNEMTSIKNLMGDKRIGTVLSFIADSNKRKIEKENEHVYFSNYTPDYFDGDSNIEVWEDIITRFIK